jgi:hypothetical protein
MVKTRPAATPGTLTSLTPEWTWDTPLRTDYERRQALVGDRRAHRHGAGY